MIIQQRHCPHCRIQRTVDMGRWGSVCMNCRLRSEPGVSAGERPAGAVALASQLASLFGPAALRRLQIYRAAVQAGFYTDSLPGSDTNERDDIWAGERTVTHG